MGYFGKNKRSCDLACYHSDRFSRSLEDSVTHSGISIVLITVRIITPSFRQFLWRIKLQKKKKYILEAPYRGKAVSRWMETPI